MRLARKATLLLALSLLTSAATAYAECAWVFWLEVSGPPTHESSSRPLSGWGTREACEQALTQRLAADSEKDTSMDVTVDPQAGRPRLWVRRRGHPELLAVYTYVCLPTPWTRVGRREVNAVFGGYYFNVRFAPEIPDEDGICGEEEQKPQKSR